MPNIRDVARACGVAPMTISAVLNNTPGKVSPQTRERILATMREMGYSPAARHRKGETGARTLRSTLGVIGHGGGYEDLILPGILQQARQAHQSILVFSENLWSGDVHIAIRTYYDGHCDGLLVASPTPGNPVVSALHQRGVPFVLVGAAGEGAEFASVDVDNQGVTRRAVNVLIERGHWRIACLAGPQWSSAAGERVAGFRDAMNAAGLPAPVMDGAFTTQSGFERAHALLSSPAGERPTALVCGNDEIAYGAWQAARDLGRRVPEHVSIFGFNDDPIALSTHPPMSTVRQSYDEVGAQAVALLVALARNETPPARQLRLPGELILRGSVGTAPAL